MCSVKGLRLRVDEHVRRPLDPARALSDAWAGQGHADVESECSKCHTPFRADTQNDLCLDCHKEVGEDIRSANGFTWFPIQEVAYLFAGIFMTIVPALAILKAGESGALVLPAPGVLLETDCGQG